MFSSRSRILRFLPVGALCFTVQTLILKLLVNEGVIAWMANVIGFVVSAQLNYLLSNRFTWRDSLEIRRHSWGVAWLGFNIVVLVALLVNTSIFVVVSPLFSVIPAVFIAGVVSAVTTYLCNNRIVFVPKGA